MVGASEASAANQTRLRCNELEMAFIAMPTRLADCELAFLDFGGGSRLKIYRSRQLRTHAHAMQKALEKAEFNSYDRTAGHQAFGCANNQY